MCLKRAKNELHLYLISSDAAHVHYIVSGSIYFQMLIFLNIPLFVGWICTLPREQIDGSEFDHQR